MATEKITGKGGNGKASEGAKGFSIVEGLSPSHEVIDTCGHCGVRLHIDEDSQVVKRRKAHSAGRHELAEMVKSEILDSFALVAGTLSQIDEKSYYPSPDEVGKLLKLMVEGAHVELALYCSVVGGPAPHPFSGIIDNAKNEFGSKFEEGDAA